MNTVFCWCSRAVCLSLLCAWSGLARADSAYDEAVAQGLAELEANNYPEAREEFRRAHALFPNARSLRGLGMVEFELRNYGECVRLLEQALTSPVKPLDAKLRAESEALLARARRYLSELRVQTDPSSATLIVDGAETQLGAYGALLLEVGEHSLEFRAPGHAPETRVVRVRGGERTELRVALVALGPRKAAPAEGARADSAPATPVYRKWWLWTALAVVVVAGATTAAVVLTRDDKTNTTAAGSGNAGVSLQTLRTF